MPRVSVSVSGRRGRTELNTSKDRPLPYGKQRDRAEGRDASSHFSSYDAPRGSLFTEKKADSAISQ